jgi:hypothetical protein
MFGAIRSRTGKTRCSTAAMIPGADGSKFSVTAANVTKLFPVNRKEGKLVALSVGRYNLVDLLDEDFFAGGGTERFFNIAQIGPLTVLRQVPLQHEIGPGERDGEQPVTEEINVVVGKRPVSGDADRRQGGEGAPHARTSQQTRKDQHQNGDRQDRWTDQPGAHRPQ